MRTTVLLLTLRACGATATLQLGRALEAGRWLIAADMENGGLTALRGFGPMGLFANAVILAGNLLFAPLSAVLVLLWARWSGTPWRDIGYVRPPSWLGGLATGAGLGAVLKLLMKAIVLDGRRSASR